MSRWKKWKAERNKAAQNPPTSDDVLAPVEQEKPERLAGESLARDVSYGAEDVVVAGGGVDGRGVDVLVPGDLLDESDVSGLAVDVGEAGVSELVESEGSVEPCASLPLEENAPELSSAEATSLSGDKNGGVPASDDLLSGSLPGEELFELVGEGVGNEDLLSGAGVGPLPLEGAEGDPPLGDEDAVLSEDVAHVERGDLEGAEPGTEGQGDDDVVSEPVFVLPGDPEYDRLLGVGEGGGRTGGGSVVRHSPIVGKADSQINAEDHPESIGGQPCVSAQQGDPDARISKVAVTAKHSKKTRGKPATSTPGVEMSDYVSGKAISGSEKDDRRNTEVVRENPGNHGVPQNVAPKAKKSTPLVVVKRSEQEFREWAASEVGFLTAIARFDDEEIRLEPYQIQFLSTKSHYRSVEKSRQVGYSWLFAGEAIARSHLRDTHNSIFVSYNLADAKEKIAYAAQMHEELPLEFQKKKVIDSKHEIGFRSNSSGKRISRIISHPSRAPRGKKGDIYLDELAHYANDREVYKGSTALILRSKGQLTVCSSPLGRRGQFWEIARQEVRPYPVYWRQKVPWWLCSFFRKDPSEKGLLVAATESPNLATKERVYRYGSQGIIDQYESMPLEDFQQEFEVLYVDETMAFYPYDLILPCTNESLEMPEDFSLIKIRSDSRLVCGFDVGRKKDLSELSIFEELASGKKICRGLFSYPKTKFKVQEAALRNLLDMLPIHRLYIDQNGIGMNLAENLADDYPQVEPFTFSGASKEMLANDFKIGLQSNDIVLPRDRRLVSEIHSIRKKTTAAGRVVFETNDGSGEGHADRFWSVAMACQKERTAVVEPSSVTVRVIN